MKYNNNIEELKNAENFTKFKCKIKDFSYADESRAVKENENYIFVLKAKSRKYGNRYLIDDFIKRFDFTIGNTKNEKNETTIWHNRLKRAIKCMEQSGLWETIKQKYQNLLTITHEEKQAIYDLYWQEHMNNTKGLIDLLKDKYSFMIKTNKNNEEYIDTDYIWELSECKLKSMYFGKFDNETEKQTIKEKIQNNENYSTWHRTNYDTSFEYNAEKKMAWYSEEYKNCRNGHYYFALDNSTALFCEND